MAGLGLGAVLACGPAAERRPDILWIVWDTVRADHLSLYGYERETTPFLDRWAAGAKVFDDALSTAGYTLPSHAGMFTGLLPSEHCTHNGNPRLDDERATVAEILSEDGYRTFLFSANPHVSAAGNLAQGFDTVLHPWSDTYLGRALRTVRDKLPDDDASSELGARFRAAERDEAPLVPWHVKAAGGLAGEALGDWLESVDRDVPWFAFLNLMEAHRPLIPPRDLRARVMEPDAVRRSYAVDRSWLATWEYTFGLRDYGDEELELTRGTYDAALLELDGHLERLIGDLEAAGRLDNTVVVLTSDHGEHLGEQHMLDHQYSLYQPLLHVPLIVHYPARFAAGREPAPVMNFDLFPTLLELAGVERDAGGSRAVSLLRPVPGRDRLAEEPTASSVGLDVVLGQHPGWDASPWRRRLRALVSGDLKLIVGSDGGQELYRLADDPLERRELQDELTVEAVQMLERLDAAAASLTDCPSPGTAPPPPSGRERELLKSLGYLG